VQFTPWWLGCQGGFGAEVSVPAACLSLTTIDQRSTNIEIDIYIDIDIDRLPREKNPSNAGCAADRLASPRRFGNASPIFF
jgi:hypothetical protein